MSNDTLGTFIDAAAAGALQLHPAGSNTYFVRTLDRDRFHEDVLIVSNDNGLPVSAVYDMGTDELHVITKPEHRRQGHLTRALHASVCLKITAVKKSHHQAVTYEDPKMVPIQRDRGFKQIGNGYCWVVDLEPG